MKWKALTSQLSPGIVKLGVETSGGSGITFGQFFQLCENSDFSDFLSESLLAVDFAGFFWELPPMTERRLDDPFECVIVQSDTLPGLRANPGPFGNQFNEAKPGENIAVFENLGGDALLIVPIPRSESPASYSHIASFLREGPAEQVRDFWAATGREALARTGSTPFWLSTAGLGVSWLHLRLDSRPKYYRYQPYKEIS